MAKRQSFILEAKPLRMKTPKTDQSNLPGMQCNVHVFFYLKNINVKFMSVSFLFWGAINIQD